MAKQNLEEDYAILRRKYEKLAASMAQFENLPESLREIMDDAVRQIRSVQYVQSQNTSAHVELPTDLPRISDIVPLCEKVAEIGETVSQIPSYEDIKEVLINQMKAIDLSFRKTNISVSVPAGEIANQISPAINMKVGKEIDEALAKGSANLANTALTKEVQFLKEAAHDLRNYGKYHINMPVWGLRPKVWILAMVAFMVISVVSLHFNRRQYLNNTRLEKVEWLYRNYRSIMSEEYMNDYILPREKIMFGDNTHKQDSLRNVIIKQEQVQISE